MIVILSVEHVKFKISIRQREKRFKKNILIVVFFIDDLVLIFFILIKK